MGLAGSVTRVVDCLEVGEAEDLGLMEERSPPRG